jgi:uncharacterized protein (UPF0332 family)
VIDEKSDFLFKAREALMGAQSEFENKRYNNAANRAYYACFHAAIAALLDAGVRPPTGTWGHEYVQAQFSGLLIRRRKLYLRDLSDVLPENSKVRARADYGPLPVTGKDAQRAVERTRLFVQAVETKVRGKA